MNADCRQNQETAAASGVWWMHGRGRGRGRGCGRGRGGILSRRKRAHKVAGDPVGGMLQGGHYTIRASPGYGICILVAGKKSVGREAAAPVASERDVY